MSVKLAHSYEWEITVNDIISHSHCQRAFYCDIVNLL